MGFSVSDKVMKWRMLLVLKEVAMILDRGHNILKRLA